MRPAAAGSALLDRPLTPALLGLLEKHRLETPFLAVDLDIVAEHYLALRSTFPGVDVYFAAKALPEPPVLRTLADLGCRFDVASPAEIDLCLDSGTPASAISYGNTIKSPKAIAYAYARGVRQFAFDSDGELDKLARYAPGAEVVCRILTTGAGAAWPLSRKFGCVADMAVDLLRQAQTVGLAPTGISFHVGSQQRDPAQWDGALASAAEVYRCLLDKGIELALVNLGGGLPAHYADEVPEIDRYGDAIFASIQRHFAAAAVDFAIEPGRFLVGDAGVLRSTVLLVSRKSRHDDIRWVYLDVGRFEGLAETEREAIRYRIATSRPGETGPTILAGPTCDSIDILYENRPYPLPLGLAIGDTIDFLSAGAYTVCYASAGFNGFSPPPVHFAGGGSGR